MYTYYILRRTHNDIPTEVEGDIDEAQFPGVDLDDGKAILNHLVAMVNQQSGTFHVWEEADLTDSFFNREDNYIFFDGRWMRRSDAPWRKDRAN